jgi:YD repeat-containing protein
MKNTITRVRRLLPFVLVVVCSPAFSSNGPVPRVDYIYQTMHFWGYPGQDITATRATTYGKSCELTVAMVNAFPEYDQGWYYRKDNHTCGADLGYLDTGASNFIKGTMVVNVTSNCRPKEGAPADICDDFPSKWTRTFEWIGYPVVDRIHCKSCPDLVGNPIAPLLASKHMSVGIDGAGPAMTLRYDSLPNVPADNPNLVYRPLALPSFGDIWSSDLHQKIVRQEVAGVVALQVARGTGIWTSYVKSGGTYVPDADISDEVSDTTGGWLYKDVTGSALEVYGLDGLMQSKGTAQGQLWTYRYSDSSTPPDTAPMPGLLIAVTDQFGRRTDMKYDLNGGSPRIKSVSSGDLVTQFSYDASQNLVAITWPDQKSRKYLYERADHPWALTGIVDEEDVTNASYQYDEQGRATDTRGAGGVDHYSVTWISPPNIEVQYAWDSSKGIFWRDQKWAAPVGTSISLPNGTSVKWSSGQVNGMPRATEREQPAGSGCDPKASSLQYDIRGNVTTRVDFNDVRSCHFYASDRRVETSRVEGLSKADVCLPDSEADPTKAQRKISTKWHPMWKLETQRAEPKLITTTIYNGEKDPPVTGTAVYCVDGDPKLQDKTTRLALVCRRYEQSTKDETGNLGFAAEVTKTRSWSYQYNQDGQLRLETDPRGKATTYEYWSETAFTGVGNAARGQWKGDLKLVTNAAQQTTNYLEYNKRGQPLTIKHPNGSKELREYHLRGWLSKVTLVPADATPSQVTKYDYFDTGLLKQVTQPDGSFAAYEWDDAHRLTDVVDALGNKVQYGLDEVGNRETETFTDKNGLPAKTISRTFDALGRMKSSTGVQ